MASILGSNPSENPGSIQQPASSLIPSAGVARPRLDQIDLLRGIIMVVMVLDHVRDFLGAGMLNPRDPHDPALFLTRWITHFCAPIFVFLAGTSAHLHGDRGRTRGQLSGFLFTRGLWLILLEVTVVSFGWTFDPRLGFVVLQVIWAIGWSSIGLAGLIHAPRWVIALVSLVLIAGHNALDGIQAESWGAWGWIWNILHQPGVLPAPEGKEIYALYPLIPWLGVMAAGYLLGPVMSFESRRRRSWLTGAGATLIVLFFALRATNLYGDPAPWSPQGGVFSSLLSFGNCEKYPPSLLYLCMTLGPALIALGCLEKAHGRLASALITLGRVPFLFYLSHIYLVHGVAVAYACVVRGQVGWLFGGAPIMSKPEGYGMGLPAIYATWLAVVIVLYPLCRWFAAVKRRRRDWWLSYL